MGVRRVVQWGYQWIIGCGSLVNVWSSIWLPQPVSFCLVTPVKDGWENAVVVDFIDFDHGVKQVFLPCDDETILQIPLSQPWPPDKLAWYYNSSENFSVKPASPLIRNVRVSEYKSATSSSTSITNMIWTKLRNLNVPPCIKLFGWKVRVSVLATRVIIAKKIQGMGMNCSICEALEEDNMHVFVYRPLAIEMWEDCG